MWLYMYWVQGLEGCSPGGFVKLGYPGLKQTYYSVHEGRAQARDPAFKSICICVSHGCWGNSSVGAA